MGQALFKIMLNVFKKSFSTECAVALLNIPNINLNVQVCLYVIFLFAYWVETMYFHHVSRDASLVGWSPSMLRYQLMVLISQILERCNIDLTSNLTCCLE